MLTIILCLLAGIALGHLLKSNAQAVKLCNIVSSLSIKALLFFLGLAIGCNADLISRLDFIGFQALILGLCIIIGSNIGAYFADKYLNISKLFDINIHKKN